jgi:hypothetical protein
MALPRTAWDTSDVLSDGSNIRRGAAHADRLHRSAAYLQLVVYLATLTSIFVLMRLFGTTSRKPALA